MKFSSSTVAAVAALLACLPAHAEPAAPAVKDVPPVAAAKEAPAVPATKEAAAPVAAPTGEAVAKNAGEAAVLSADKAPATAPASGERTVEKKVAPPPKPQPSLVINVDLTRQKLTVSEKGSASGSWAISSGRSGYRTPTGTFRPQWMAKTWYSRKYDNAPMPNSIFFTGGFALHATYATGMLGRPASHGCVRQSPANAARLYAMVRKHGMDHTKIVVHGSPRDREPAVARQDRSNRYAGTGLDYAQPRVTYRQQPKWGYDQPPRGAYYVRPQKKGVLAGLFGDDEPPRYYYVRPSRGYKGHGRPIYGYDSNGNLVRIR